MFEKHLWKSDILSKDAGHIIPLPQVFFKHFANKNQLPGFYISGTLVENGLSRFFIKTKDLPFLKFLSANSFSKDRVYTESCV